MSLRVSYPLLTLDPPSHPSSPRVSHSSQMESQTSERIPILVRLTPSRPLDSRDIINVDLTLYYNGYHGDTSATFCLPDVDQPGRDLVEATREALHVGIRACGPGKPFNAIGKAIGCVAPRPYTWCTSRSLPQRIRFSPWVLCQRAVLGSWDRGVFPPKTMDTPPPYDWGLGRPLFPADLPANTGAEVMRPGDCFTIEPSLVQGYNSRGFMWEDGWTMSTEVSLLKSLSTLSSADPSRPGRGALSLSIKCSSRKTEWKSSHATRGINRNDAMKKDDTRAAVMHRVQPPLGTHYEYQTLASEKCSTKNTCYMC